MLGGLIAVDTDHAVPMLLTIFFVSLMVGYWSFLPAFAYILIAELAAWRGWLSYAVAGAAIALLVAYIAAVRTDVDLALAFVAAGMTGGLAYWAVAGRNAGKWLDGSGNTSRDPAR